MSDSFYVNCGVAFPALWPGQTLPALNAATAQSLALSLHTRLHTSQGGQGFDRSSKAAVHASAQEVLTQYALQIQPWLDSLNTWQALADEYLRINSRVIGEDRMGRHDASYGADFRAATYGALLLKAGQSTHAQRWLTEAQTLLQAQAGCDLLPPGLLAQVQAALASLKAPSK